MGPDALSRKTLSFGGEHTEGGAHFCELGWEDADVDGPRPSGTRKITQNYPELPDE
jgi:hypothetical protein